MIRVALLSPLFESVPPRLYGGTERVVYNLCRGLTASDIEVTLFASGDSTVEGKIIPVIDEALRLRKEAPFDPYAYNLRMLALVAKQAHEFDVIHNHHDYWGLPLSEMTDTPVLTTLHGRLDIPEISETLLHFPHTSFISISNSQRTPMPSLPWVRTIYHGLDLDQFQFYPNPGQYLAFLGRISAEKKPEWAIEIAKKCGIPLKIAAKIESGAGQAYYDQWVRPHVDGRFIEYVGEISEAEKSHFLGEALALLFPIDWPEPFGLVVIEALACGTPVLARPCGSVPELLQDGVTGFCHNDIAELARKTRDLPRLDRRQCRKWVADRFSLHRMTEEYIHVYQQLAQSRYPLAQRRGSAAHRRNLLHSFERPAHRNSETDL